MNHKQKIIYMDIGLRLCGIELTDTDLDIVVSMGDLINRKGGKVDMKDTVRLHRAVKERAIERSKLNKPPADVTNSQSGNS